MSHPRSATRSSIAVAKQENSLAIYKSYAVPRQIKPRILELSIKPK